MMKKELKDLSLETTMNFLRKYTDLSMGNLFLTDKYLLEIEGKTLDFFFTETFLTIL